MLRGWVAGIVLFVDLARSQWSVLFGDVHRTIPRE